MFDLRQYGLARNPFSTVPTDVDHWSGRDRERELLLDVYQSVLYGNSELSEFMIIVGEYGSGKTHALEYFRQLVNEQDNSMRAKAVLVPKVKLGPKVSWLEVYRHVVKQHLGSEFFRDLAARFASTVEECENELAKDVDKATYKMLIDGDRDYFSRQVIDRLSADDRPYAKLLMMAAIGDEGALTFLTEGLKGPIDIGLPREVKNDYHAVQVLGGIFRIMTLSIEDRPPIYRGVHFAIDEVEELLEGKTSEQQEFWYGTRELINRVPRGMAFVLAFSTDAVLLEAMISGAVLDRATRQNVELEAFSPDAAKDFVMRQLEYYRPEGYAAPQPFHPFTAGAVEYVLEQTVPLVPRRIFLRLRQVLEKGIRREGLAGGEEIDRGLVEEMMFRMGI